MNIADNKIIDPRYAVHTIKKSDGKARVLTVPNNVLMEHQKNALRKMSKMKDIKIHSSATGFTEKKSVITNALIHRRSNVFWMFDIKSFFDSITRRTLIKYVALNNDFKDFTVAREITSTKGYKKKYMTLTQGSPTSPFLSNAVMYDFDRKATNYFNKMNITYTRYADDITLSQKEYMIPKEVDILKTEFGEKLQYWLNEIAYSKLELKPQKTRAEILTDEHPVKVVGIFIRKENRQHRNNYLATGKEFNENFTYSLKRFIKEAETEINKPLAQALLGKYNWFCQVNRQSQKPYKKMMKFIDKTWTESGLGKDFKKDIIQYMY